MERTNRITIHQAFYGEVERSHGCIVSSIEDSGLKSFLTAFTDRPSSIPGGIKLEPYYSGVRHQNYYIFTLTFSDENASRGGMVFTHALITQVDDLDDINSLEEVFSLFIDSKPEQKIALNSLASEISILQHKETSSLYPKYVQQTVEKLISSQLPILFCGALKAFEKTISAVWQGLPTAFRIKFSYTAAFSNSNLDSSKTILHFQKSLINTLKNQPFISDEDNSPVPIESEVEQYLLNPKANNKFELFLRELNVNLNDWTLLTPSVKAFQSYANIDHDISPDELRLLLRTIAKISPNKNDGRNIKKQILSLLGKYISSGKDDNIKALKNLSVLEFENTDEVITQAIHDQLRKSFENKLGFNVSTVCDLCISLDQAKEKTWWHNALSSAFHAIVRLKDDNAISNLWKVLLFSEASMNAILRILPSSKEYETLLISNMPSHIDAITCERIAYAIQRKKWILLHAHIILKYLSPANAIVLQMQTEESVDISLFEGSQFLLSKLSNTELFTLTFSENKDLLTNEFARRCTTNEHLLAKLDVKNSIWLKIWSESLVATKSLDYGVGNLREIIEQILDQIVDGKSIPDVIVSLIAKSEHADISNYPKRKELWPRLSSKYLSSFIDATAVGYVDKLVTGTLDIVELEPELNKAITTDRFVSSFLSKNRNDINSVISLYEQVAGLKDRPLADYINYFSSSINELQSARLGNLVKGNGFVQSANQVFEKAKRNNSFKIALNHCQSLLNFGFWDLWFYGNLLGKTVSDDAAFQAIFDISVRIYPLGPEDRDIWRRAGGNVGKLTNYASREDNWRQAIHLLRYGGGGRDITPRTLIKEMLEDFPNNNELKEILKFFRR